MSTKLVWTSDPAAARKLRESGKLDAPRDTEAARQTIRVTIDRKARAGKSVTVASGFELTAETLGKLAAQLKKRCGSGGTVREDSIEIQGDHVSAIKSELGKLGYKVR